MRLRIIKYLVYTVFFVTMGAVLSCCNGKRGESELPKTFTGTNLSVDAIEANINALAVNNWTDSAYSRILDNQINAGSELEEQDRMALTKMLREAYTDQLLRCIDSVMTDSCSTSHDNLGKMMADLLEILPHLENDYRKADIDAAKKKYDKHVEMMGFVVQSKYPDKVHADSYYDSSYDSQMRSKAAAYRNLHPTCTTIRNKIDSKRVESALTSRRNDFQNKLAAARAEASYY